MDLIVFFFIVLGFNDTSTLVGQFVSSSREREKIGRMKVEKMRGTGEKENIWHK